MDHPVFVDTNVLLYMFDPDSPMKQQAAVRALERLLAERSLVVSFQVVQEFLNASTRRFADRMSTHEAQLYVDHVLWPACKIQPSFDLYRHALAVHAETQWSFYDSLIVAAAMRLDCRTLLSEDLQSGRVLGDLEIVNPFS